MVTTHLFRDSHKFGKVVEGAWYWPDVYGLHFGGFQEIQPIVGAADNKKYGDHRVVFRGDGDTSGHYQYVDVKARTKRYADISIESHHSTSQDPFDYDKITRRGWAHPYHECKAQWVAYDMPGRSSEDFRRVILYRLGELREQGYIFDKTLDWFSGRNEKYWSHFVGIPWYRFVADVQTWHYAVDMNARRIYELPADMQDERDFKP